jgi:hypothetical protein
MFGNCKTQLDLGSLCFRFIQQLFASRAQSSVKVTFYSV